MEVIKNVQTIRMNKFGLDQAYTYKSPTRINKQIIISECQEDALLNAAARDSTLRLPKISSAMSYDMEPSTRSSRSQMKNASWRGLRFSSPSRKTVNDQHKRGYSSANRCLGVSSALSYSFNEDRGGDNCSTRLSDSDSHQSGRRSMFTKNSPCNLSMMIIQEKETKLVNYQKLQEEVMKNYEPIKRKAESAA